jgi:hypothetical protein
MKRLIFAISGALAVALIMLPVSFFITVYLYPIWTWIENEYGIEAMGHSGPAEWCFWLVYILLVGLGPVAFWLLWRNGWRQTDA